MNERKDNPVLVRCADGEGRHEVPLESIQIPDVYNLASYLEDQGHGFAGSQVNEIWHLAHDMLNQLKRNAGIDC